MDRAFVTVSLKFIVERRGHVRQDMGRAQSLGEYTSVYELKDAETAPGVGVREVDYVTLEMI